MIFTVVWLPDAERELADIWMTSAERNHVTAAASMIDEQLRRDPDHAGESRSAGRRILIAPPLVATYRMRLDDRIVTIVNIREFRSRSK
jgi:plasmid stabilization system protein ParE